MMVNGLKGLSRIWEVFWWLKKASLQVFYLQPPVLILADAFESSINVYGSLLIQNQYFNCLIKTRSSKVIYLGVPSLKILDLRVYF
jgi:hypothetical protein